VEPSNKKPGRLFEKRRTGAVSTSGLLAFLFSVVASRPAQITTWSDSHSSSGLFRQLLQAAGCSGRRAGSSDVFFAFGECGG
jgi:hypothetical protein